MTTTRFVERDAKRLFGWAYQSVLLKNIEKSVLLQMKEYNYNIKMYFLNTY